VVALLLLLMWEQQLLRLLRRLLRRLALTAASVAGTGGAATAVTTSTTKTHHRGRRPLAAALCQEAATLTTATIRPRGLVHGSKWLQQPPREFPFKQERRYLAELPRRHRRPRHLRKVYGVLIRRA